MDVTAPLFHPHLGSIRATPTAASLIDDASLHALLTRHHRGDRGELALKDPHLYPFPKRPGFHHASIFPTREGFPVWVITSPNSDFTFVFLTSEDILLPYLQHELPHPEAVPSLRPLFRLGRLDFDLAITHLVPIYRLLEALGRHSRGDWGCAIDTKSNDAALISGGEIRSTYLDYDDAPFQVITHARRISTAIYYASDT